MLIEKNIPSEVIFSVLRTLKSVNEGDQYYEAYLGHYAKQGKKFFDIYHFAWEWVIKNKPKRILEIGTRTGLSMCQLLSAYVYSEYDLIERIVCCDLFADGFINPSLVKLNLKTLNIPEKIIEKVDFKVGDSKIEIPKLYGEKFDYCLVDGDHSTETAITDLRNCVNLVNSGGVIVFDDISPDGCNLLSVWKQFESEYFDLFDWNYDMNGKGVGWCIRK